MTPVGRPSTVGSLGFDPDAFFAQWAAGDLQAPQQDDLQGSITRAFHLKDNDAYVYHAMVATTLGQVQQVVNAGDQNGLHAWYTDAAGSTLPPPPRADSDAYANIFLSTTATDKALTALEKNAKKDSIRSRVADHLISQRQFPASLKVPKLKAAHTNPYLDVWIWSCQNLEWAGPDASTAAVKHSHHILPILYHHFGCICPTFESLHTIKHYAAERPVYDMGSGNGYWAYMLRRMGLAVHAVDNGDSLWRSMWIGDTVKEDAARYLQKHKGGADGVLLLVYPQVTTDFTRAALRAFKGDTVCVAGTQNSNGFTAFKDMTIDRYMSESHPAFQKAVQTPLPSFAGKDEALFVFTRRV